MSEIEPSLLEAYQNSIITVHLETGSFIASPKMGEIALPDQLLPFTWIITAHNPGSRPLPLDTNNKRQEALWVALRELTGAKAYPAVGSSVSGDWSEASIAVTGVDFDVIAEIGRSFEQNAIYRLDSQGCSVALL